MDKNILVQQINVLLNRERIILNKKEKTWSIQTKNRKKIIKYEHSKTLIDIYSGLQDIELKKIFTDNLFYYFVNEVEIVYSDSIGYWENEITSFSSTRALIFFTLLQLGFEEKLMELLKVRTDNSVNTKRTDITLVYFLNDLVSTENRYFDIELISSLIYFANNQINRHDSSYGELIEKLQLSLADLGYDEVKKSILSVNIEINRDKEKLITIFSNNGFDVKYEQYLEEIDEYINTNSTVVTSGMIGNMRSFMEGMVTDLARKIAGNCCEEIPKNKGSQEVGNNRTYLKTKLDLSDNDNQLINKYIDVLHAEGGHSFTSNVEYFRLAKNIGIEISLFLLSKADNLNLLRPLPDF